MPLKNSMIGELPNIKITSTADLNDTTVKSEASINNLGIQSSPNISRSIHPSTGDAMDHRALDHLDYESSGHTGFASSKDLQAVTSLETASGTVPADVLQKLKSNYTAKVELGDRLLSLSVKAGDEWTYVSAQDDNGDMAVMTLNSSTGEYTSEIINPAQNSLEWHTRDTSIHVSAGDRQRWDNKVSARVVEDREELHLYK